VNTIVLPCDLHWDVTGITKVIRHRCPLPFYDKAGAQFRDEWEAAEGHCAAD
jgi:hypothetical protein